MDNGSLNNILKLFFTYCKLAPILFFKFKYPISPLFDEVTLTLESNEVNPTNSTFNDAMGVIAQW